MSFDKSKDVELWQTWKRTQSPQDLDSLLKQMEPVIQREVGRWKRIAPEFLLNNEAKRLAIKAFENYDPNRQPPTALGTHVTNALLKLTRTAYARQSTLSIPEAKRLTFNNITKARVTLEEEFGRPPTLEELSDHMRLPPKRMQMLMVDVAKREFMESGEGPTFVQHTDDPEVMHLAWHDMSDMQKKIFEHRTGYNGAPVLSGTKIMRETGLSQGQLSHQIGKIKTLLSRAQTLR